MAAKKTSAKAAKKPAKQPLGGKKKTKKKGSWFKAILISVAILLIVRLFCLQSFVIQSTTMAGNLITGDWVFINKMAYGPRMPITLLSVPFAPLRTSFASPRYFSDWLQLPNVRLPGYNSIQRNDIVAFNYPNEEGTPIDKKVCYVKRIVALPSDTLKIRNHSVFVNNKELITESIQFEYRVITKSNELSDKLIQKYKLNEGSQLNNYGEYELYITAKEAAQLRTEPEIKRVYIEKNNPIGDMGSVFPHSADYNWTADNFGPIVVPGTNKAIVITPKNLRIYRDILEKYENCEVAVENDIVYINNKALHSYLFKHNYYFVMDDNRDNGKDSRMWGFLPDDHIIGKVSFVVASFDPEAYGLSKMRWSRLFKSIR